MIPPEKCAHAEAREMVESGSPLARWTCSDCGEMVDLDDLPTFTERGRREAVEEGREENYGMGHEAGWGDGIADAEGQAADLIDAQAQVIRDALHRVDEDEDLATNETIEGALNAIEDALDELTNWTYMEAKR